MEKFHGLSAVRRLKKNLKIKANLGYIVNPCLKKERRCVGEGD